MSREPRVKAGDLVEYEGESCRVLKRRRVTGMAMLQTSEHEVLLETLDGEEVGWVGENELEQTSDEPDEA
jgi:hypothetical protein